MLVLTGGGGGGHPWYNAVDSATDVAPSSNRHGVGRPLPILLFFFCVFSAPFLGRALLQGSISAPNICSFRAYLLPLLLAKMCQLFLFLFCPLDVCSFCGFCSLCAPDTTFSLLCTALVAVVFTAFATSRFMCWVFRCHCAYLYEACIYFVFCLYDIMILQHHILCRFLEVGPCPPAQTVGTCPVNRAPKTLTSYN